MKTKTTKFLRTFLTLALAVVLCLGTALPALAAPTPVGGGTEGNHAKITLKKTLKLASNLTVPNATFQYTLAPVDIDGDTTQTTVMPAISIPNILFGTGDTAASTANGVASYSKESAQFPANSVIFPRAGVYTYTLAETNGTYSVAAGETMTYDTVIYAIKLYVKNGTSACYVDTVEAWITSGGVPVTKIDPTPGSSEMEFVNNYSKTTTGNNPTASDILNKLFLSKGVTGEYADQSKYFTFTVKVTAPSSAPTVADGYRAYVINTEDLTVVTSSANYSGTIKTDLTYGDYIEFTSGNSKTINLKHNQKLVFIDLPIGTSYEMVENAASDFKGSVLLYQGSSSASGYMAPSSNTAVSTNSANGGNEARVAEDPSNGASFTNAYTAIVPTPTGIIIDNLPFILLLAVTVGALVLGMVVKTRRRRGYTSR